VSRRKPPSHPPESRTVTAKPGPRQPAKPLIYMALTGAGRRFRRMRPSISWRLGFRQSSFRPITRVPRRAASNAWARPPLQWHAAVPFTFRIQVSHRTQEPPSEFLPAEPGIQPGASWRTAIGPRPGPLAVPPAVQRL